MIDVEGFVLIGGRSSRLGVAKAFVDLGGMTLAERAARTIEAAFDVVGVKFIAGADNQFPAVSAFARPVVFDLRPGFGPWSGLHAALAYARSEWALVLACDYPFVSAELLGFLVDHASDDHEVVVPVQTDGRLQPLCAVYRVNPILNEIEALLDSNSLMPPLREFLDRERTRRVEADEYSAFGDPHALFLNINTQDDLARARMAK